MQLARHKYIAGIGLSPLCDALFPYGCPECHEKFSAWPFENTLLAVSFIWKINNGNSSS